VDEPIRSRPYKADMCCERCVFGRGEHSKKCPVGLNSKWHEAIFQTINPAVEDYLQAPQQGKFKLLPSSRR
jgi:hypothetical protein